MYGYRCARSAMPRGGAKGVVATHRCIATPRAFPAADAAAVCGPTKKALECRAERGTLKVAPAEECGWWRLPS